MRAGIASALVCIVLKCTGAAEEVELGSLVDIPGGMHYLGSAFPNIPNQPQPDGAERPRRFDLEPYQIEATTVSVEQFEKFVEATSHVTEAEKYDWSFVMEYLLDDETVAIADDDEGIGRVKGSEHWVGVAGANWRHPEGPRSNVAHRRRYPAVHMTYNDAQAYCKWARRRLPTEAEWEAAARGGFRGQPYPWGDVADESALNTWQGDFPDHNTAQDGYAGLAPVDAYAPNPLGVWNSVGNVWEWVSGGTANKRIMKGGSYVDTLDGRFNHAATVATRMTITQDSGGHNVGFRCATGVGGGGEENGDGESGGGSGGAKKKKKAKKKRESPPSSADEL